MTEHSDKHPLLVARDGVRAAEAVYRKVIEQRLPVGSLAIWFDDNGYRHSGVVIDRDIYANRTKVKVGNATYWITIDDIIRALEHD